MERAANRAEVKLALERAEAASDELCGLSLDALSHKDLLAVAERIEALTRRKTMLEHRIVARLDAECAPRDLGAKSLPDLLARRLRISRQGGRCPHR